MQRPEGARSRRATLFYYSSTFCAIPLRKSSQTQTHTNHHKYKHASHSTDVFLKSHTPRCVIIRQLASYRRSSNCKHTCRLSLAPGTNSLAPPLETTHPPHAYFLLTSDTLTHLHAARSARPCCARPQPHRYLLASSSLPPEFSIAAVF